MCRSEEAGGASRRKSAALPPVLGIDLVFEVRLAAGRRKRRGCDQDLARLALLNLPPFLDVDQALSLYPA